MEDVLIVFIVFSCITVFGAGIYKLIRAKMDRTGIDEETFDRLAKAFVEYKKDSNRRIQNLEAIVSDEHPSSANNQIEEPSTSIEIEEDEQRRTESGNSNNLRNMLHEE